MMTDEKLLRLSPSALRTYLAIRHSLGLQPPVQPSMEELEELTGYKRQNLSRAISELKEGGFVEVTRTKRNLGKFFYNNYFLPGIPQDTWQSKPGISESTWQALPCIPQDTSTGDSNSSNSSNDSKAITTVTSNRKNPRYKEIRVVSRWKDDDDEIGGFGLFEDEKPASVKSKLLVDSRDPKTRGRRPEAEWTPADVATEFAFRLGMRHQLLPGLVKTQDLRGALARNRKQYGITAVIELEILRMFMADDRYHKDWNIGDAYKMLPGRFLRMFTTHMDEALRNLGMPTRQQLANTDVAIEKHSEYIYASDGRAFDNSIPGRRSLEKYEEKLKVQNGS